MLNVIERLDRDKFAPAICVLKKGGKLDQEVEAQGIPLLELPFMTRARPYRTLISRARQLALPFQPHQFQLWHSFHYGDDYTEPLIARLGGAKAWVYTKKNMNWHRRAWHVRTLMATRAAAQNTDMLGQFFAAPYHNRKIHLIPRGVVATKFAGAVPALKLRERLDIPAEHYLVGCVAQLVPVKGHPTLLAAAADLPDVHLLLAGKPLDSAYAERLHEQAAELGISQRVTFLDYVEDIPAFLAELDLFVFPSRMEGSPVALLEAMASGCAAIANDVAGSHDLIVHGDSGWLVPAEDQRALATALRELLDQPELRRQLGEAAQRRVATHYTIEQEVAAHEKMYAEALGW